MNNPFSPNTLSLPLGRAARIAGVLGLVGFLLVCRVPGQTTNIGAEPPFVPAMSTNANTKPVVVTAPATLTKREGRSYLTITNARHSYEFYWSALPVSLVPGRSYTFTVVEENSYFGPAPKVIRVDDKGTLVWDEGICEVHKVTMQWKMVPVSYGLYMSGTNEPSCDEEQQLFPHRHEVAFGGCVTSLGLPQTSMQYVCPGCKAAYDYWKHQR
jgi:hypothetical protein